jgi:hypothetical protein
MSGVWRDLSRWWLSLSQIHGSRLFGFRPGGQAAFKFDKGICGQVSIEQGAMEGEPLGSVKPETIRNRIQ